MNESLDPVFDAVLVPALELLAERTGRTPGSLRDSHERRAYELLGADHDHSGRVTLSARSLADLLDPTAVPTSPPRRLYAVAESRRQERNRPAGWLEPGTFARCLADARKALEEGGAS